jgi:hypothetical protein
LDARAVAERKEAAPKAKKAKKDGRDPTQLQLSDSDDGELSDGGKPTSPLPPRGSEGKAQQRSPSPARPPPSLPPPPPPPMRGMGTFSGFQWSGVRDTVGAQWSVVRDTVGAQWSVVRGGLGGGG